MIRCLLDAAIPQDSKCAKCCIYCTESNCEYKCPFTLEHKTEKEIIGCSCAYEE